MFSREPQMRTTLASELDVDSSGIGNWKSLADKFNIPKRTVDQFGKFTHGPTENLFAYLEFSKNEEHRSLTVEKLRSHLKEMDRGNVAQLLDQEQGK